MNKKTALILKACSLSMGLMGSVALVAVVSLPDVAYAKNGNGNGGGNGNKSESTKSNNGKSATDGSKATKTKTTKPKKKDLANELGISPSELGALNAAHASANALEHASPNSRVGRIAAYRDAVLEGRELEAELEEKSAFLETLTEPERPISEIESDVLDAEAEVKLREDAVAEMEKALADAGGEDAAIEADLADARSDLNDAKDLAAKLNDELDDAVEYETVKAEVEDLTQKVEDQPELERSLLEAASNKPVTDGVEAAVKRLLGL